MELVYNEETGVWEQRKEPYATIEVETDEVETEEDYKELIKAVEFYKKYKDMIQHD